MIRTGRIAAAWSRYAVEILGVLGCLLLIAVALTAAWFSYRQHGEAEHAFQLRHAADTALVLEVHARDTLASVDDAVRGIKRSFERSGGHTDLPRLLEDYRDIQDYIVVASVADEQGRLIRSTLPIPAGTNVADLEHFRVHVARDTGAPYINKPVLGRVSGKWAFHISRRINRADGSFGGVAIVAVDFSYWSRLLQDSSLGDTAAIVLVGRDGVVRAASGRAKFAGDLMKADWGFLLRRIDAGERRGFAVASEEGGHTAGTWAYRSIDGYPLVVAVNTDERQLQLRLGAIGADYKAGVLAVTVLASLFAAGLLLLLRRQRTHAAAVRVSETRLNTIAEHIGEGLALYDHDDRLIFFNEPYRRMQAAATPDLHLGLTFETLARDRGRLLAEMGEIADVEAFVTERLARHRHPTGSAIERKRPDGGYHLIREARTRDGHIVVSFIDITEAKRREAALRESEGRFRAIFDHAGIGISLRPAHDRALPWLAVNDKFCEMTGYHREELLRLSTADLTPADDQGEAVRDNTRLLSREISSYAREKRLLCKDGSLLWVTLSVAMVPDASGRPYRIISTYQDLSARKRAESRLLESEGRLRAIIAAEPECVAIVAPDGALLDMNPAGLRMLEAGSVEEMRRWPLLRQITPQYRRAFVRLQRRVLAGYTGTLEFAAVGIAGKRCWLEIHAAPLHDASGEITAMLGIARDVTERRSAREALAAERNLLRTVIDNLPDHIHVKDRDRRFVLVNASWMRDRPAIRRDVVSLGNYDIFPADAAERYEAEDIGVMQAGQQSMPREVLREDLPGGPRWFVIAKIPLRDAGGAVIGSVGISRDVTEIKQRALEVEKLNAALEVRVAERTAQLTVANEELEAFASSVSHDLRAPLRHIDGLAAAVLEDYAGQLDAAGQDYLRRIRAAALRMAGLIEDLLRLSRVTRTELKIADVDLSGMARDIADELHREYPVRKVTFRVAPLLRVQADPGLLQSALANLIHNAWKFTGNKAAATIEIGATQRDGVTAYFVRDNGAGFDMNHAGRLFDAFQRLHTEQEFPGTGIGLATVRRIMRRHGGDAWAESALGKGATFFFSLRGRNMGGSAGGSTQADARAEHLTKMADATIATAFKGEPGAVLPRVLLVDDDPDVLVLTARALAQDGYQLLTAGRGADALVMLREQVVSVVVSDFSMPGMDGAQLLAQVAGLCPDTLRVIVSGQTMNRAMQTGLRKGEIHHYFEKQHNYEPLRACIRDWLKSSGQTGKNSR